MFDLVLLCDNYPLSPGEFFIDDEMRVLYKKWNRIIIIVPQKPVVQMNRFVPDNLIVVPYNDTIYLKDKIVSIPRVFSKMFFAELKDILKRFPLKTLPLLFKIMYMDMVKAFKLIKVIKYYIKDYAINSSNSVFYSYWHDYKALSLAILSKKYNFKSLARGHGWDVFADRHNPPYLPFKHFIINNLSVTVSISKAGANELIQYTNNSTKVITSKLGKFNERPINLKKNNNSFLVCSCSNIIPLKRLHKIIEILQKVDLPNIKWVHFGDGELKNGIIELAEKELHNVEFEFKGIVPNNEILDFYSKNYVDLFINVSESEGIPVSITEALSAGIPVIATDVGGTSEIVNKETGFLIEKDFEVENVARKIENYLKLSIEEQKIYREKAYKFWKENYNAEKNYKIFTDKILAL